MDGGRAWGDGLGGFVGTWEFAGSPLGEEDFELGEGLVDLPCLEIGDGVEPA